MRTLRTFTSLAVAFGTLLALSGTASAQEKGMGAFGEKGRITHWDGTRFVDHPSGTTATLFGVWAASPSAARKPVSMPPMPANRPTILTWLPPADDTRTLARTAPATARDPAHRA